VFDVLTDHRGMAAITALRYPRLEREGSPEPNGVGAVRALGAVGPPFREEVTEFERPHRFSYRALSGVPTASEHGGTIDLTEQGGQTLLRWRVNSSTKLPLPDAVWVALVRPVIKQLLNGVVKESERRTAAAR
jgi:Polyketide cyclase / dehydrase and lipid transport